MILTRLLVTAYLAAITAANLTVALFGATAVLPNAFILIAFDLTARDALHSAWEGKHLARRMALLIGAGSALSAALAYLLSVENALPVATASLIAFALAGLVDTAIYAALRARSYLLRINGSNVLSAAVDSAAFLSFLALFSVLPWSLVVPLALGQWGAKVAGGALWSIVLPRLRPQSQRKEVWQ